MYAAANDTELALRAPTKAQRQRALWGEDEQRSE